MQCLLSAFKVCRVCSVYRVYVMFNLPLFAFIKGLTLDQVDTLWTCLATDPECGDEALSWFLNQAGNKDHHALGLETFKHIFFNKVKLINVNSLNACRAQQIWRC